MGIVYIFEESENFLHNICGNELQNWVPHSPLHQPAIRSTSTFSFDDLVFKIIDFILFPLQILVYFTDYSSRF